MHAPKHKSSGDQIACSLPCHIPELVGSWVGLPAPIHLPTTGGPLHQPPPTKRRKTQSAPNRPQLMLRSGLH